MTQIRRASLVIAAGAIAFASAASAADSGIPAQWKNCTAVNAKYPHGIGKAAAHDSTSAQPVTTFKRSNNLYALAMNYNSRLDRDKDGIACEQA